MGIHFDYRQEYRQNWFYVTAAMFTTISSSIFTFISVNIYLDHLFHGHMKDLLTQPFDHVQVYITMVISTTFTILLHTLYKRFAVLNSFLTYAFIIPFSFLFLFFD